MPFFKKKKNYYYYCLLAFLVWAISLNGCFNQTYEDPEYGITLYTILNAYMNSSVYEKKDLDYTAEKDKVSNIAFVDNGITERIRVRAIVTNSNNMVFAYSYDNENGAGMVDRYNALQAKKFNGLTYTTNDDDTVTTNRNFGYPEVYKIYEILPKQKKSRLLYFMPASFMIQNHIFKEKSLIELFQNSSLAILPSNQRSFIYFPKKTG